MEKKHPIDNLFSERLHNYERQPSDAAWQKLQSKLESKKSRRIGGWMIYTIAASVALLLVAGLWVINQNNEVSQVAHVQTQGKTTVSKANKSAKPTVPNPKAIPQEEIAINQLAASTPNNQRTQKAIRVTQEAIAKSATTKNLPSIPKQGTDVAPVIEKAINQPALIAQEVKPLPPVPSVSTTEEKTKPNIAEAPIVAKSEPTQEKAINTTLVVNIAESAQSVTELTSDNNTNTKKNSRIARIFKQLKKAKEGEKVDWDEVGFNPNRLIAKADELVHPKGKSTDSQNR